ncbi:acetolactate synthase large subunit [Cochlodiniinecator piscidefendens]|uniref:acetolactate synthase large subunit n=1 Tax=Cochlodiniinecator piscidefendens TaxID=2715756 RepID=UPI00140CCBA2|nr:acetolactate synthase large subunit [Cochlodiniinecator piscidefendens]
MTNETGAHFLLENLLKSGVDTCFANPGTSEMHLTAAMEDYPDVTKVLCLFEGGATGAADGYARMTRKPAATLLHLGPGLANGLANLHNAKKAGSSMINIVGDHTTFHKKYDAPLNSDVEGTARPYSDWVKTTQGPGTLGTDAAEAIAAAKSHGGQIATLIIPADVAWSERDAELVYVTPTQQAPESAAIEQALQWLQNGKPTGIILGQDALFGEGLKLAGQIAAGSGATLLSPYASARTERGYDLPETTRIPFPVDAAVATLSRFEQLILIGADEPVAFFAYPGKPSRVAPETAKLMSVATPRDDIGRALKQLATLIGPAKSPTPESLNVPVSAGALTPDLLTDVVAASVTEGLIIVDEGVTSTRSFFGKSAGCPRHDYLVNVGGSIGAGLPLALGAGIACPDRPVLCLSGDGSAAFTLQALWSMARHNLNVTTIICANNSYEILKGEMFRVGAMTPDGPKNPLLELDGPCMNWVSLAEGFGVSAQRCETAEDLTAVLQTSLASPGPYLIEAAL